MDQSDALQRVVRAAIRQRQVVQPGGGGTKGFLHPAATDAVLVSTAEHDGILHYHPDELVIRVRSGTRLVELQETLREAGQYLPCEPPSFGSAGTVGGMVAAGLAGPSRPYVGGVRDYVLGMKLILPSGEIAAFGGDVMKNVAGYDITRLNVGARGSLGLMLEVALKVLPIPEVVQVYGLECDPSLAQEHMLAQRRLAGLSASAYCDGALLVRYQGSEQAKPTFEQALGQGFQPVSKRWSCGGAGFELCAYRALMALGWRGGCARQRSAGGYGLGRRSAVVRLGCGASWCSGWGRDYLVQARRRRLAGLN